MKLNLFLVSVAVACTAMTMTAQEAATATIVTEGGQVLSVSSVDISGNAVYYQTTPDDPIQRMDKSEVMVIKYSDGKKWMPEMDSAQPAANAQTSAVTQETGGAPAKVSYDDPTANEAAKKRHSPQNISYNEISDKDASQLLLFYEPTESSVIADANIEVFLRTIRLTQKNQYNFYWQPELEIVIKNLSSKTVYVDLGNTFLICDGNSNRYYVPTATANSHSTSTGASVNLGAVAGAMGIGGKAGTLASGVNVGGSSAHGTSTVVYSERILSIPPRGTVTLPAIKLPRPLDIKKSKSEYGIGRQSVSACFSYQRPKDKQIHMGEKSADFNTSLFPEISTLLTYALDENMSAPVSMEAIYQPSMIIGSKATSQIGTKFIYLEGFSSGLDECLYIWMVQQQK